MIGRLPDKLREYVVDVLQEFNAPISQKRASLQKKGLSKANIDELEWLYEDCGLTDSYFPFDRLTTYAR